MNYDENSVHIQSFRLSVKMVKAFEETFELQDKPHLLPTLRALCLQTINTYLLEDRPISLEVKNEVMEFYIEDFNDRNSTIDLIFFYEMDDGEVPQLIDLADNFKKLVLKNLQGNDYYEHVKTCLNDMREEDLGEYVKLMAHFFVSSPNDMNEHFPAALLTDYSLPNDIDLDDVEVEFRQSAYAVLPQLMCAWENEYHPLNKLYECVHEIVENSRNVFANLEQGLVSSQRLSGKIRR